MDHISWQAYDWLRGEHRGLYAANLGLDLTGQICLNIVGFADDPHIQPGCQLSEIESHL